jgi:hypothetical protein
MKICITEASVKDFNAFFKAKARELQKKHKFTELNDLYKALYNEAMVMSGDTKSSNNHDVVIQHLVMAPLALVESVQGLGVQLQGALSDSVAAFNNSVKLETIVTELQKVVSTPNDFSGDDEGGNGSNDEVNHEDVVPGAIHIHFNTTIGAETMSFDNVVDEDKVLAFEAKRTILHAVNRGERKYKLKAMTHEQMLKDFNSEELDLSTASTPADNKFSSSNTIVMITVDESGKPVKFASDGTISEQGLIPVYSTESPTKVGEAAYDYFVGNKKNNKPEHKLLFEKFEALERNEQRRTERAKIPYDRMEVQLIVMGEPVVQPNGKTKYENGWVPNNKALFAKIRKNKTYLLDINPSQSNFGYSEVTNNKTQLSDVKGIENYTFNKVDTPDGYAYVITGSEMHEGQAHLIPNDIDSSPETVDLIVKLLTDKSLKVGNVAITPQQRRDLVRNYIGITADSDFISLNDKGVLKTYGKTTDAQGLRDFLTTFKASELVEGNPQDRIITKDLNSPDNTSAMLYEDTDGNLYKIYKPKFSYIDGKFSKIDIATDGNVTTKTSDTALRTHVIKNSSTKSFVNEDGVLKVYHPKLAYIDTAAQESDTSSLNKTVEQKEAENRYTKRQAKSINSSAFRWFNSSPLVNDEAIELDDKRDLPDTAENRTIVANWTNNIVTLFTGSEDRDLYHEAWHAYTQGILTKAEKRKMYTAVRKLKGKENLTDLQAEEWLADEFQNYAEGKSQVKATSVIGKFFEAIWNSIKAIIGNHSKSDVLHDEVFQDIIQTHFNNLYTHNIDASAYSPSNYMFKTLNKNLEFLDKEGKKSIRLSAQDTATLMDSVDVLLVEHLDTTVTDSLKNGFQSVKAYAAGYAHVKDQLDDLMMDEDAYMADLEQNGKEESPEYELHSQRYEMLKSAIANFGDTENFENNITNGETANTVIGFHLKNSKVNNYNVIKSIAGQDENIDDTKATKLFERLGNDQSLYDMADEHIVYMLSTIPKFETKRHIITSADVRASNGVLTANNIGDVQFTEVPVKNILGLNTLERPVVVMAKLGKLLNSTSNGDVMRAKMLEAAQTDPTIDAVLKKLGWKETDASNSMNQQSLWSKFIQTFQKSHNKLQQFIMEATTENGVITIESKFGSTLGGTKVVSRAWDAAYPTMESNSLKSTSDGVELDSAGFLEEHLIDKGNGKWQMKNKKGHVAFFRALGINITDKAEIESELADNHDIVNHFANRLHNQIKHNEYLIGKGKQPKAITSLKDLVSKHLAVSTDGVVSKQAGLSGYYNRIQRIEYNLSDKYNSFMETNAEGENQSALSLNNTASVMTNDINEIPEGTSLEKAIADYPHLEFLSPNDPFMRSNRMFKALFDDKGKRTSVKLEIENLSGSSLLQGDNSIGLSNMHLDRSSKFMTDVYLSWLNKSEVTRMADKTTSLHMGTNEKQTFNPTNVTDIAEGDTTMYNALQDYLVAEIVRMNTLKTIDGPFDQSYIKRGSEFFIFDDILSKDVRNKLKTITSTDFDTVKKNLAKQDLTTIISEVNDYFVQKTNTAIESHAQDLFVSDTVMSQLKDTLEEDNLTDAQAKDVMIGMFIRNKFLHNLDIATFYLGDPALYNVTAEDFHKRNAGLISTGSIFRTDKSFFNFINQKDKNGFTKARGWSNAVTKKKDHADYNGTLNVGVTSDHTLESEYKKHYAEHIDEMGEYAENEKGEAQLVEADGQGFITFDAFRMLSLSEGIWTENMEKQYNLIVDRATTDENGNVSPGKYDQSRYDVFFPSMKLQYFGQLKTDSNLRQQAFHKFNLIPLIPGMIKGTKLEQLHKSMMEQGVDYMTFDSGSKVSTLKNESAELYSQDRVFNNDYKFEKNVIHVKFLKNQLKIHNKFKEKVTLPTQMRKILVSKLYKPGTKIYISPAHEKWHKGYLKALSDLTKFKKKQLENELGIVDKESLIKNSEKLVNMIRREFTDKDYTEHQIEFLFENNQLKKDLSTALNAAQVEKLLIAMVDKRVTKIKVKGEGLIQMASTMTEEQGTTHEKGNKVKGSNGLRSYYNEGGDTVSMQVKIALQGDFEQLLHSKDLNGKRITVWTEIKDAEGKVISTEMDYDATLAKLNSLLKTPEWVEKYKEIITLSAPRIPSDKFHALEFMEVLEFLPKNSGTVMIVPTEIVAKTGSDFDVDKLFTMFPSFTLYNGVPEMIEYVDMNIDADALNVNLKVAEEKLKDVTDELTELYENITENKDLIKIGQQIGSIVREKRTLSDKQDELSQERIVEIDAELVALNAQQEYILDEALDENNRITNKDLSVSNDHLYDEMKPLKEKQKALKIETENIRRQINGSTVKGLENNLLRSFVERLSMEDVFPELIKPMTKDFTKDLADELEDTATNYKKKDKIRGDNSGKISPTQIFDALYNINKQVENNVGMDTLGIGAIASTYHAIFQSVKMYLNRNNGEDITSDDYIDYTLGLPHNVGVDKDGNVTIDMASEENANGENIADILGELINGWVDVAKDAYVFNLQANKEVAPTLLFLISAGVSFRNAVMLSSSRLVRDYIEGKQASKSAFRGLVKLDRTNSKTFDLIQYESELSIINDILRSEGYPVYTPVEKAFQDKGEIDIKNIEDHVLNPDKKLTDKQLDARTNEEVNALLHFFTYEQTAKQITDLTIATKFDTATSSTLAEIRNNKALFDDLDSNPALPVDIKDMIIKESPIGMFDTNDFQLNLWERFFSLKTHEVISNKANEAFSEMYIKGRKPADNEKDFAEEFISYIYQNEFTRIKNNVYKGLEFKPSSELGDVQYEIEDGVFTYNELEVQGLVSTGDYGNTNSVKKYFVEMALIEQDLDMNSDEVKNSLSYELALKDTEGTEDTPEYEEDLENAYINAEALFRSGNAQALFRGPYSYKNRLEALKKKHPTLEQQFSLVRDLTPDTNTKDPSPDRVQNLILPNLSESGYNSVYEENLDILKEHPIPDVKRFFKMFDRYAVLQSGVKTAKKYNMTTVIDPMYIDRYVKPVKNGILSSFDKSLEATGQESPVIAKFADEFYQKYVTEDFKKFLATKQRYTKYENDYYFKNSVRVVDNTPMSLRDYQDGTIEGVQIEEVDLIMAETNDKIIIVPTTKAPSKSYIQESKTNKLYAATLKSTEASNQKFSATDSVWVVGENINNKAFAGNKNLKDSWDTMLDETYKKYDKLIDKAIKSGVESFTVGNRTGIEKMVRKKLQEVSGKDGILLFKQHKFLTKDGFYYKYTTGNEEIANGKYSTGVPEIKVEAKYPELNMNDTKGTLTISRIRGKSKGESVVYDNIYKYSISLKSQYSTPKSKQALASFMDSLEKSPTRDDYITMMDMLRVKAGQPYNELAELGNAIYRIAELDPSFKETLLSTGRGLLNYNNLKGTFSKNFSLALMNVRALPVAGRNYNGPVTETSETTDEDMITCAG